MTVTKIQKAIYTLLKDEPFFAHFLMNCKFMYDAFNVKTAGVTVLKDGTMLMIFNREFMGNLTDNETVAVLKHEVLHLLLAHVGAKPNIGKHGHQHHLYNLATDCAINQHIKDIPAGGVTLESLSKAVKKSLAAFQTSDYYYKEIIDFAEQLKAGGPSTTDDHDLDGVPDKQDNGDLARAAVKDAAKKAAKASAGKVPSGLEKEIFGDDSPQLSWKQLLRNFVMTKISVTTRRTFKKVSRKNVGRYIQGVYNGVKGAPLPIPGRKREKTLTLGVCVDSSGSVSDEQFKAFMAEIASITKNIDNAWLIDADCEVQSVQKIGKKNKLKKKRTGGGGTAYQPAINKCLELKCDAIIYFGDFDSSDVPTNPRVPFLWVGVGNQEPPGKFGRVVRISG